MATVTRREASDTYDIKNHGLDAAKHDLQYICTMTWPSNYLLRSSYIIVVGRIQ